jgi:tol-pal system protein YbgF
MKKISFLFILFLFIGCATQSDLDLIKRQLITLSKGQKEIRKEYKQEIDTLKNVFQKQLSSSNFSVRASQADIVSRIESLRLKIANIEGEYDHLTKEIFDERNSTAELYNKINSLQESVKKLEEEVVRLKSILGLSQDKSKKVNTKITKVKINKAKKEVKVKDKENKQDYEISPRKLYERALLNFKNKNYYTAAHLFSLFIEKFSKHKLVPNALFWRGECFYRLKQYPKAILNYQEVLDKYPDSNKYPGALLKEGIAFYKIGKQKAGRILLEDLIKNFPHSNEANTARKFLKNIRQF